LLASKGQHRALADLLEGQAQRLETANETGRAARLWSRYATVAEHDTKEIERAISGHRKVVALAPTSDSLRALARLNLERSQPGQAVPWLESLLGTVPANERLMVVSQLAKAHLSANQPDRAIAAIEVNLDDKEPAIDLRPRATATDREVRLESRCAAVSAFLHAGFYSLTPDGEVNRPRDEVKDAVRSWESRQFAKWIDPAAPGSTGPLGDELEIVPVTDLRAARAGDKATFRVLLDGEPFAGATVAVGHRALGETDGKGEVRIRIRTPDVESVSASVRRPLRSPKADALVLEASLTFPVAR